MNPKSLIAPVVVGAVILLASAFYIKTQKAKLKDADEKTQQLSDDLERAKKSSTAAEKDKKAALDAQQAAEKALADKTADLDRLTTAKKAGDTALAEAQGKIATVQGQLDALQKSSGDGAKAFQDLSTKFEATKKSLADTEALQRAAEAKLKTIQGDYTTAKAVADSVKESNFLTMQYKTNAEGVRKQVEQLLKDVPDLAAKLGAGGASAGGGDSLRAQLANRMVMLNLEGQFTYDGTDQKKADSLTWAVGAVVIGMDSNQVYLLATPPLHLLDQPAAVNSLTKNCLVQFSVSPPGWAGVKEPLPAVLLGVLRGPNGAAVAVFATSIAEWPQGREKPLGLIPAPTVQECRQWSDDGDLGFVYARGIPAAANTGPVKIETPIRVGEQQVALIMPAQATGFELGLFGTYKAPTDKSILGVYYPEGNRVLWLSDLYNGAKAMVGEIAKLNEVGGAYVGSDWVVTLAERKTLRGVDAIGADFVTFLEKR
ncbi:MAG TPA: hypothetical protein VL860_08250 [Planctomycetota bacterium]|nr:hypothetical protein [Planctomycetota bacterium]